MGALGLTLEQMRLALRNALSFMPKSNSIISIPRGARILGI